MPEPPAPDDRFAEVRAGFAEVLVGFARELRAAGLPVGTGDVVTYVEAAATLSPSDLLDLYWAGRVTLVTRRDDIPPYDRVFRAYFLAEDSPASEPLRLTATARAQASAALVVPAAEPGVDEGRDQQQLGLLASDVAALKHRSFASCNPDELAALRRIMRTIKLTPPRRRTRRTRPAPSGTIPDLRNTIRNETRLIACPAPVLYRQRTTRLRPLVLVLDVSGSMADYSRHLLQFAHTARHAAARVEVFCFGTRLTRITRQLRARNIDLALQRAGESVRDWESGTRIGESLDELVRRWGRAGLCRGAVVVICSDGLDRGDPELLAASMQRLARLAYRVVWLNPHKGDNRDFRPSSVGMMVAAPHVDLLLSGHDLASLEELAALLPVLN
ncbi:MAG TPA: VWA domain-containing protein [Trebonia sp.]|nr:VWA domain-containing protein [Trebonia sp.]